LYKLGRNILILYLCYP